MTTYTVDYNTAEMQGTNLISIYCIVRGENENGAYETIGEKITFETPILIENFDALTKEQVDAIVQNTAQFEDLKNRVTASINARQEIVVKEFSWNTPKEEPPPVVNAVPVAVTPLQIRMAINAAGLRDYVEAYVQTLSQSEKDAWEYATVIERSNPVLVNGAIALGKTEKELDDLFILASTLV